jgi:hypothetical protein
VCERERERERDLFPCLFFGSSFFPAPLSLPLLLFSLHSKRKRMLKELCEHMNFKTSATSVEVRLHVVPALQEALIGPLAGAEPDIPAVLEMSSAYGLSRDDVMETLKELQVLGPGRKNPFDQIQSKVKSAFTRKFKAQQNRLSQGMGSALLKGSTSADFRKKSKGGKRKAKAGGAKKKKPAKKKKKT